jgi:hypothetical protein
MLRAAVLTLALMVPIASHHWHRQPAACIQFHHDTRPRAPIPFGC